MIKSINDNKVFQNLNRFGAKIFNPNFLLIICDKSRLFKDSLELQQDKICYYGIRISKKVGKAVVRNKIRRRLKSIIFSLTKSIPLYNQAVMLIPKTECATVDFKILTNQIEQTIKKHFKY